MYREILNEMSFDCIVYLDPIEVSSKVTVMGQI